MFWMRNEVVFLYALLSGGLLFDGQDIKCFSLCFFRGKCSFLRYKVPLNIEYFMIYCFMSDPVM